MRIKSQIQNKVRWQVQDQTQITDQVTAPVWEQTIDQTWAPITHHILIQVSRSVQIDIQKLCGQLTG